MKQIWRVANVLRETAYNFAADRKYAAQRGWQRVRRLWGRVPDHAGPAPLWSDGAGLWLAATDRLEAVAAELSAAARADRIATWKTSLGNNFALAGGSLAYRYVKRLEQGPPPVGIDVLGVTEVRPPKMAKAIRAFWSTVLGQPNDVSWDEVYTRWRDVLAPLAKSEF